jgi:glycosyltransferase involved in cell wall biosynthesis
MAETTRLVFGWLPEAGSCIFRMIADVPEAIEAVRKRYFNRELGKQLGQNGRAFVQQYTPEIQAEKWHRIFQGLMAQKTGSPAAASVPPPIVAG